ncbi:MAG: AI-2E family transporter [bacterium]|jgi:AI-2 transport protein TqsA
MNTNMLEQLDKFKSYIGGLRFWIIFASVVIVIAGLKAASFLVNVLLLSAFVTSICLPFLEFLKKKKIPETLAIIIVILSLIILSGLMITIIGSSISSFIDKTPYYEEKFHQFWTTTFKWLSDYNLVNQESFMKELHPKNFFSVLGGFLSGFGNVMTSLLLVLIIFIFMIFEASTYGRKLKLISPVSFTQSADIRRRLSKYFGIKFITSFATGLLVTIGLLIMGVDFPVLWGFIAFVLNFIPSIGSFIAAVPGVLLALIQLGPFGGLITAIIYFVINTLIGNIIEPQLMGRSLGLSPVIVFIAMVFWGYVLGPVGMLFATPLMIVIKIIFDSRPVTKDFGILLSDEHQIRQMEKERQL